MLSASFPSTLPSSRSTQIGNKKYEETIHCDNGERVIPQSTKYDEISGRGSIKVTSIAALLS